MRSKLPQSDERRLRVRAILVRSSVFRGRDAEGGQTLLFRDVVEVETGSLIRDHVWLPAGDWWTTGGSNMCDVMCEFTVTIGPVLKGYLGERQFFDAELPVPRVEIGFYDPADLCFARDAAGWPIRSNNP